MKIGKIIVDRSIIRRTCDSNVVTGGRNR